jgi:hypothetical protein
MPRMRQLQPSHDVNESTEPRLGTRQTRFRTVYSWPGTRGDGYAWIRARRRMDDDLQFRARRIYFWGVFQKAREAWPGWPRCETRTRACTPRPRSHATQAASMPMTIWRHVVTSHGVSWRMSYRT